MAYYYGLIIYYLLGYIFLRKNVSEKKKKRYVFFALLPAFLLVALRSVSVGNDTYTYYYAFERYKAHSDFASILGSSLRESGFLLLNYACIYLGLSYTFMQIIISAFIYYSFYRFISKYSEDVWLSCLLFLLNRHMFGTMNTMRMWLAIAILLYAVPYVLERKLVPVVILTIVAMMFHFTAIVFLVIYFMVGIKWNIKNVMVTIFVSAAISFMGRSFFSLITRLINRYSGYLDGRYFDSGGIATYISLIIQICFFVFVFIEYRKWNQYEGMNANDGQIAATQVNTEGYMISAMLVMLLLDIVGLNNTIMSRVSAYFAPAMYLAIPYSLSSTGRNNRRVLSFAIVILLLLNFLIVMHYRPGWYGVSNYTFFWQSQWR